MATTARERQRALNDLHTLELMVGDLPEVASEWSELSDGERESWSHDWDNEMVGLPRLIEYAAQGLIEGDDARRYEQLTQKLRDAAPLIRRLRLRSPQIPLTA